MIITTLVYEKYSGTDRTYLWEEINQLANSIALPWLVGGDFNNVLSGEEKIGGLPVITREVEDFANCINNTELYDAGYKGSPFTWWNGRTNHECIFERIDRILVN